MKRSKFSEATFYNWKSKYGGLEVSEARWLRTLKSENAKLKKLLAGAMLDNAAPCPLDHVNRQFQAARPNALWLSDFTYVATWTGFVHVAFIFDACAWRIVGWGASRRAHAGFVLDALEQALHDRRPLHRGGLVYLRPTRRLTCPLRVFVRRIATCHRWLEASSRPDTANDVYGP